MRRPSGCAVTSGRRAASASPRSAPAGAGRATASTGCSPRRRLPSPAATRRALCGAAQAPVTRVACCFAPIPLLDDGVITGEAFGRRLRAGQRRMASRPGRVRSSASAARGVCRCGHCVAGATDREPRTSMPASACACACPAKARCGWTSHAGSTMAGRPSPWVGNCRGPRGRDTTLACRRRPSTAAAEAGWAGHPRGLATLFLTEMWERFSYYGMRAFLILYMTAPVAAGGLGFAVADAASIYGTYTGSVWGAAILGGLVADRFLGAYRSVLLGGIIIALGHVALAFKALTFFYLGLGLIVVGTGLLKPNVSTLVGALYREGDSRRDAGFSVFYMGINLGAFLGPAHRGLSRAARRLAPGLRRAPPSAWRSASGSTSLGKRHLAPAIERLSTTPAPRPPHGSAARRAHADRRRMEAHRRHRGLLPLRVDLLGRVRAGRLDAEPLWRPLHPARGVRLQLPLVLVPDRAADGRHRAGADVRVALAAPRPARAVEPCQVRVRPGVCRASPS